VVSARRHLSLLALLATAAGCGPELDVGSDLLWTARFESGTLDEVTGAPGGSVSAFPGTSDTVAASTERAHTGAYGVKLTIDAEGGAQQSAGFGLSGDLPTEAYYSAWYYLPRSVTVGMYWVIFKIRMRTDATDPGSDTELYDVNLANLDTGEMTLRLFDHRNGDVALDTPSPVVPVGAWFQLEALYRNANDASGRFTLWLDGRQIVDVNRPMAPTPWVAWDAISVAIDLTPPLATLHVDDCAVSRSRVGPQGRLVR
jgi:hypothetical protein